MPRLFGIQDLLITIEHLHTRHHKRTQRRRFS
jgi:hypothetical protein